VFGELASLSVELEHAESLREANVVLWRDRSLRPLTV
jgi:hypothetical protein